MADNDKFEKEQYLGIINQVAIITRTDTKGIITYVNEIFCEVSGYTKEELIGKPHNIIRHPDEPKSTYEIMWKQISSGKVFKGKLKNKAKDGTTYYVLAYILPIVKSSDSGNVIVGYMGIRFLTTEEEETRLKNTLNLRRTFIKQKVEKNDLFKEVETLRKQVEFYVNQENEQINKLQNEILVLKEKVQREKTRAENAAEEAIQYKERLNKVNEYIRKMINNR